MICLLLVGLLLEMRKILRGSRTHGMSSLSLGIQSSSSSWEPSLRPRPNRFLGCGRGMMMLLPRRPPIPVGHSQWDTQCKDVTNGGTRIVTQVDRSGGRFCRSQLTVSRTPPPLCLPFPYRSDKNYVLWVAVRQLISRCECGYNNYRCRHIFQTVLPFDSCPIVSFTASIDDRARTNSYCKGRV